MARSFAGITQGLLLRPAPHSSRHKSAVLVLALLPCCCRGLLGNDTLDQMALRCSPHHVSVCFSTLEQQLGLAASGESTDTTAVGDHECPFFVTLNKWNDKAKQWELRGCIGTLSARPLVDLHKYAIKSAFHDSRFEPLEAHELPHLQVGVSLLVDYEAGAHATDWEVGLHGIIIDFAVEDERYSATYLPEVAAEQGWTQEDAVRSLIRKAGYRKPLPPSKWDIIKLTRYKSSKHALTYDQWIAIRTKA